MYYYNNPNGYNYGFPQQQTYPYQPQMQVPGQNMQVPLNQNALTPEEINKLRSLKPNGMFSIKISEDDVLRSMCTHCQNGESVVYMINDGSGRCACPICGAVWMPDTYTKEEIKELCDKIIDSMQSVKWAGELTPTVVREYFTMIPLLDKFPDLYEYATKNMAKMFNQRGFMNANDANIYNQYNSLFGTGYNNYGFQQPYAPAYGQNMPYYNQQPMQQPVVQQNPMVNPMQVQQPQYGFQQPQQQIIQPVNTQFVDQAGMMMPGYAPQVQQQINPQQPYAPVYGQAQPMQQPQVQVTVNNPQQPQATAPVQQPLVVDKTKKIDL